MFEILVPLTPEFALVLPQDRIALIAWVIGILGIILVSFLLSDQKLQLNRPSLIWSAILSVLILILTPFLGILPRMGVIVNSGEVPIQHLMFFAAVPWMVAGGILGIFPATLFAGFSGLLLAYLDTSNVFTPLVLMIICVIFSWCLQQRFRTVFFKWLRFPVFAALVSLLFATPIVMLTLVLSTPGTFAARTGIAVTRFPMVMFALGGMVLMGGVACVIVQAFTQPLWGGKAPLKPAPGEANLTYRLLVFAVPIYIILLIVVFISSWRAATLHHRQVLVRQMTESSAIAGKSLDIFVETGNGFLNDLTTVLRDDPRDLESINQLLSDHLQSFSFFQRIALFNQDGGLSAGTAPALGFDPHQLPDNRVLSETDFSNENVKVFLVSINGSQSTAAIFVVKVENINWDQPHVLWAETILEENYYAQSFLRTMEGLSKQGGYWQIVADDGRVMLDSGDGMVNPDGFGSTYMASTFYRSRTDQGQTLMHYYHPSDSSHWGIAITFPSSVYQEQVWRATYPVLIVFSTAFVLVFLVLCLGLSPVIKEMNHAAMAIQSVASGHYDHDDLINHIAMGKGQFSRVFHKLLVSQKRRMDKQEELISVSGRIAGQLNLKNALHNIMAAALNQGASTARVMFVEKYAVPHLEKSPHGYGLGRKNKLLESLDEELFQLSRRQDVLVLQGDDVYRFIPGVESILELEAIIIVSLKWKDLRLGVFWVAFEEIKHFDDYELGYYEKLGYLASSAIVNAKTYTDSQSAQGLLEDIFDLIPDAVLFVDRDGRVLSHNKAVDDVLGLSGNSAGNQSLESLLKPEDLVEIEQHSSQKPLARTIHLVNGKVCYLLAGPVRINAREVGKAIIIKDLTQQRDAESLKTELITTVSHELRSPLMLILGYAKILRLTGTLNDQQDAYISNIIDGLVEMMTLVEKLLDIGRLEGEDPLDVQSFSVKSIAKQLLKSMEAQARQKNVQIELSLPDDSLMVEADQTFLTQALKNLLDNAIKFSKVGGEVSVSVYRENNHIVFAVQDQGIGIAPLDQRKLYKKFSRVSAQINQNQEGSGLGLAIVKSIVERHGGQVDLESKLGKGSTFFIKIPVSQD